MEELNEHIAGHRAGILKAGSCNLYDVTLDQGSVI